MNKKTVGTIISIVIGVGALWALNTLGAVWGIALGIVALGLMKVMNSEKA